ncbi:hypothetical protein EYF80_010888 [Liparis tanakae]|uniref:Uncharacterized protein n=1 Tax=Liparis tanakae TaxID=230148 RepID=A0A4Z2IP13_9TELE|nr:hypothetical protein EYF80_010888 [Liparis tanakae]
MSKLHRLRHCTSLGPQKYTRQRRKLGQDLLLLLISQVLIEQLLGCKVAMQLTYRDSLSAENGPTTRCFTSNRAEERYHAFRIRLRGKRGDDGLGSQVPQLPQAAVVKHPSADPARLHRNGLVVIRFPFGPHESGRRSTPLPSRNLDHASWLVLQSSLAWAEVDEPALLSVSSFSAPSAFFSTGVAEDSAGPPASSPSPPSACLSVAGRSLTPAWKAETTALHFCTFST